MMDSTDESRNCTTLSINPLQISPTLGVTDENITEGIVDKPDQPKTDQLLNGCNSSNISDPLTDNFVKMQNLHINQSKCNKYDYTPLQFAKSLFDKMIADTGVASERKNYYPPSRRDSVFDSFATPNINNYNKNPQVFDIENENPILSAFKHNVDGPVHTTLDTSAHAASSINNSLNPDQKMNRNNTQYFNRIYINGNHIKEFNSEYDGNDDGNFDTSKNSPRNNSMFVTGPSPNTSQHYPIDFYKCHQRNLLNVLEEPDDIGDGDLSTRHRHIISPSKFIQLDSTTNKMSFKDCKITPLNNIYRNNNPTPTCDQTNNTIPTSQSQSSTTVLKNQTSIPSDTNKNFRNQHNNLDQVNLFKSYAISGKLNNNTFSKNNNSTLPPSFIKNIDNLAEQPILMSSDPQIVKHSYKTQKRNIFKRLFRRLRHRNRFNEDITNDTITSLNTEFNRSHLNKTIVTNKNISFNSMDELRSNTTPAHSKSVNFIPNINQYAPIADSLIEEYDRDQQNYNSLKQQANIQSIPTSTSAHKLTKMNSINNPPKNNNISTSTIITFYIGADDIPFKTEIKVEASRITLKMIKNVLPKLGKRTKYYFKVSDPDNTNGCFKEVSEDCDFVPLFEGMPICKFFSQ